MMEFITFGVTTDTACHWAAQTRTHIALAKIQSFTSSKMCTTYKLCDDLDHHMATKELKLIEQVLLNKHSLCIVFFMHLH